MTIYGVFDFKTIGGEPSLRLLQTKVVHAYGYCYTPATQIIIAIGVVLIAFGVLIYKEKNKATL